MSAMPLLDEHATIDLARFCALHDIDRRAQLIIEIFGRGHPEQSPLQLLFDFARGVGAAAIAAGRAKAA